MLKRLLGVVLFVAVALVSQVAGLALALAWITSRWLLPASMERWQRTGLGFLLFGGFYGLLHVFVVPPLAALGGRVPLPCAAEPDRPFAARIRCSAGSTGTMSIRSLSL